MNLDPRSSRNYKQSIARNQKANQGARFPVGHEMLTAVEIAERAGCAVNTVNKWVKHRGENPQNFINRMRRKHENKSR